MKTNSTFLYLISVVSAAILFQACGDSSIGTSTESEILSSTEIFPGFAQKTAGPSPQEVYDNFVAMVEKVQQMSREEIEAMSDEEILKLGEPILTATENTIKLSDKTLQELKKPAAEMADRFRSMSKDQHNELSSKFEQVIRKNEGEQPTLRNLDAAAVKSILLDYAETESGTMQMSSTCSSMFNIVNGYIFLYPGDSMNTANSVCPAGSIYYVHSGTYYGQSIQNSKDGNTWVGVGTNPIVLNGQNSTKVAFKNGMNKNSISWFTVKNYQEYGIFSTSTSTAEVIINRMRFENIGAGLDGQSFGAILFEYADDIEIRYSYFENVTSSIRFKSCQGPLVVKDNEALNSGRNFLQCNNCTGAGIRINDNSMDYTAPFGSAPLEDWLCGSGASCSPAGSNNYAWAPPSGPNCGINFTQIRSNVEKDLSLDETVWNSW